MEKICVVGGDTPHLNPVLMHMECITVQRCMSSSSECISRLSTFQHSNPLPWVQEWTCARQKSQPLRQKCNISHTSCTFIYCSNLLALELAVQSEFAVATFRPQMYCIRYLVLSARTLTHTHTHARNIAWHKIEDLLEWNAARDECVRFCVGFDFRWVATRGCRYDLWRLHRCINIYVCEWCASGGVLAVVLMYA